MKQISSTCMTSNGEVEIPKEIRKALKLHAGDQFIVFYENDAVIFKVITTPSMEELDILLKEAKKQARKAGLTKADVKAAIAKARKK